MARVEGRSGRSSDDAYDESDNDDENRGDNW